MDPVSQSVVGAVFPQSVSNKKEIKKATLIGLLAGMAADLDIIIRSSSDPLLFIDYHRQFTHSLIFIPFGGLIVALLLWPFMRRKLKFKKIAFYSTLGYATHCILDSCTTYGTELLWPFSNERIAWNNISVVDPIFTIVVAIFVIVSFRKKSVNYARIGILFLVFYLLLGTYQRDRAEQYLLNISALRGHNPEQILVHPTIGNIVLWRSIYRNGDTFFVDGIRPAIFTNTKFYEGNLIKKFDLEKEFPNLESDSILYNDILRFKHFTNDYLVFYPPDKTGIADLRYSALPNEIKPLWGIETDLSKQDKHIKFINFRDLNSDKLKTFWLMLMGKNI